MDLEEQGLDIVIKYEPCLFNHLNEDEPTHQLQLDSNWTLDKNCSNIENSVQAGCSSSISSGHNVDVDADTNVSSDTFPPVNGMGVDTHEEPFLSHLKLENIDENISLSAEDPLQQEDQTQRQEHEFASTSTLNTTCSSILRSILTAPSNKIPPAPGVGVGVTRPGKTKCYKCGKYIRSDQFKQHFAKHKPYHCEGCASVFVTIGPFLTHKKMALCSQTSPSRDVDVSFNALECDKCHRRFKTEDSLVTHEKRHGEFKCDHCTTRFHKYENLHRHIKKMHPDSKREIECYLCRCKFNTRERLEAHKRNKHGIIRQVKPNLVITPMIINAVNLDDNMSNGAEIDSDDERFLDELERQENIRMTFKEEVLNNRLESVGVCHLKVEFNIDDSIDNQGVQVKSEVMAEIKEDLVSYEDSLFL